jgi:synaptobrevin family protein YKT6
LIGKYKKDAWLDVTQLHTFIVDYQTPEKVDKIAAILKDVKQVKEIALKSIDQLLENKEKLEEIAQKSEDLSAQSKEFMKRAKQLNRWCCIIL